MFLFPLALGGGLRQGSSATSEVGNCPAKSGAFSSVVEAFVLMRMVGYLTSKAGNSIFKRAKTWWPSCTVLPDCS